MMHLAEKFKRSNIVRAWVDEGCPPIGRWVNKTDNRAVLGRLQRSLKEEFGMSMTDYRRVVQERSDVVQAPSVVYTGATPQGFVLQEFTGQQTIEGDVIVTGDYQLPTTDWVLAEMVLDVARHTSIKTLLIVGDWINCDQFSFYASTVPTIPYEVEAQFSIKLISRYAGWFDRIILCLGNHEKRLLKAFDGQMSATIMGQMLAAADGKFQISPYPSIDVLSGGVRWHCTHPRNYSRIKGRLGDALAQKHQCNVIVLHQHHVSKSMDSYARYVVIDGGGLFDTKLMAYVSLEDSNSPVMCQGFTVIQGGVGHLITPYPAFTDLAQWGIHGGLQC